MVAHYGTIGQFDKSVRAPAQDRIVQQDIHLGLVTKAAQQCFPTRRGFLCRMLRYYKNERPRQKCILSWAHVPNAWRKIKVSLIHYFQVDDFSTLAPGASTRPETNARPRYPQAPALTRQAD